MHTEGQIRVSAGSISYTSPTESWSVPLSRIKILGEYTTPDGPLIDDYFLVLVMEDCDWVEVPFGAAGFDEAVKVLSAQFAAIVESRLARSTTLASRVILPKELTDTELFEFREERPSGWRRLFAPFVNRRSQQLSAGVLTFASQGCS